MRTDLPELNQLFFPKDSDGDHAGDSCCLSLDWDGFSNEQSKWSEVRDQHLEALRVLAAHASLEASDHHTGWLLGRPLVFAADHAAELALKTALLPHRARWPRGPAGHQLGDLLELDRQVSCPRPDSHDWEDRFVVLLDRAWEAGRYPDGRDGTPLFDEWCCVSANVLVDAVRAFADLVARQANESEAEATS